MPHHRFLVVILLCLFLSSFRQNAQYITRTLFDQQKINGRVSVVVEVELTPKSDGTKTDSTIWKRRFDNKGNPTLETYSSISHVAPNVDIFDYNGDKINKKRLEHTSIFKYSTHYDSNGEKTTTINSYGNKENYFFSKNGLLNQEERYQNNGTELVEKSSYKYDNEDRVIEINTYTERDSLYEQDAFKYNDKGLVVERDIFYDENRVKKHLLQSQYLYEYLSFDKFGNWTKRKQKEIESGNLSERIATGKIITDKIVIRKITYY